MRLSKQCDNKGVRRMGILDDISSVAYDLADAAMSWGEYALELVEA